MEIRVVQTPCVELMIIKLFVLVYQITSGDRQIAVPNVLLTKIVPQRWLVFAINARVHAMARVDQMLIAPFSITKRTVSVMKVSLAIHLAVVTSFYVRILLSFFIAGSISYNIFSYFFFVCCRF